MKRVLIFCAVTLFFLLLVGAIVFKFARPTPSDQPQISDNPFKDTAVSTQGVYTDTPYRTAVSCYTWYVQAIATMADLGQVAAQPQATQCFTHEFIATWQTLAENTGSDPVIQAQDFGTTWASAVTAETIGQSIKTTDERVTLGRGDDTHQVIAHIVQQEEGNWQIDTVSRIAE